MTPLVASLSRIGQQHLLVEKRLLAPNRRVGLQWLRQAARVGPTLVNFRVTPLRALAFELAGPRLIGEGWQLVPELACELIVERLWREYVSGERSKYLRQHELGPGFGPALAATLTALRLAGLGPDDLEASAFEVAAKGEDLRALLGAYQLHLKQRRWLDEVDLYHVAVERILSEPNALGEETCFLIPTDLEATGLARRLLDQLPDARKVILPTPISGPQVSEDRVTSLVRLRFLAEPAAAPGCLPDETVEFGRALGESAEVESMFRRCLAECWTLDSIEAICTEPATYVPLLYNTAVRLFAAEAELPINFAMGLPVRMSRVGRAFIGWLNWVQGGYLQCDLVPLLREGFLRWNSTELRVAQAATLAKTLADLPIGRDYQRYLEQLSYHLDLAERQGNVKRANDLRNVEAGLKPLVALLPEHPSSAAWLRGSTAFLEQFAAGDQQFDNFSRDQLLQAIQHQEHWLKETKSLSDFPAAAWLMRLVESSHVMQQGPVPGKLHVSAFPEGGHSGRSITWLLGLDEERVRPSVRQDPLLLDSERKELSPELSRAGEQILAKQAAQLSLLARLRGRAVFSYSCRTADLATEQYPSGLYADAWRMVKGTNEQNPQHLVAHLPQPGGMLPKSLSEAFDPTEAWQLALASKGCPVNAVCLVQEFFPARAQGLLAERARESSAFTEFDGYVPDAGKIWNPAAPKAPAFSAQSLEILGQCPRRFYFDRVLKLKPPAELEQDSAQWLSPLERGRLLHEVFHQYHSERLARQETPDGPRDRQPLLELLHTRLAQVRRWQPQPLAAVEEAEIEELRWTVLLFLSEEEKQAAESRPLYLEASVGLGECETKSPFDVTEPLRLTVAENWSVRVAGRLDRIDQLLNEPAHFVLWDYKTGSIKRYAKTDQDPLDGGRLLQPLVYLLLAETRLRQIDQPEAQVVSAGYFFPGERGQGERRVWPAAVMTAQRQRLGHLTQLLAHGLFLATEESKDCEYCAFSRVCDVPAVNEQSRAKLEVAQPGLLECFQKVRHVAK